MLVNAIAQVAPFDVGAKQALLEQPTLDEPRRPARPADAVPAAGGDRRRRDRADASVNLDRQPAKQQRKLAAGAAGLVHQPVAQRADAADQAHAEPADRRGGLAGNAVDARQAVGRERDR